MLGYGADQVPYLHPSSVLRAHSHRMISEIQVNRKNVLLAREPAGYAEHAQGSLPTAFRRAEPHPLDAKLRQTGCSLACREPRLTCGTTRLTASSASCDRQTAALAPPVTGLALSSCRERAAPGPDMGGMSQNQQMPQGQPLLPMTSGFPGQRLATSSFLSLQVLLQLSSRARRSPPRDGPYAEQPGHARATELGKSLRGWGRRDEKWGTRGRRRRKRAERWA
eukprot:767282-Hanusia_phi.AAC.3